MLQHRQKIRCGVHLAYEGGGTFPQVKAKTEGTVPVHTGSPSEEAGLVTFPVDIYKGGGGDYIQPLGSLCTPPHEGYDCDYVGGKPFPHPLPLLKRIFPMDIPKPPPYHHCHLRKGGGAGNLKAVVEGG